DFIDYRLGIEMQAASIVADRIAALRAAGDEDAVRELLAPLQDALERTRTALAAEEVIEAGNADLELHRLLAELARNPFLISAMSTIVILTRMGSFSDPLGFGVRADITSAHQKLLDALSAGDASRARAVLRETLQELAVRLRSGGHTQPVVRDPDLLESDGPEWTALREEGAAERPRPRCGTAPGTPRAPPPRCHRGRGACSSAETRGFEPPRRLWSPTPLAGERIRPLCHVSWCRSARHAGTAYGSDRGAPKREHTDHVTLAPPPRPAGLRGPASPAAARCA